MTTRKVPITLLIIVALLIGSGCAPTSPVITPGTPAAVNQSRLTVSQAVALLAATTHTVTTTTIAAHNAGKISQETTDAVEVFCKAVLPLVKPLNDEMLSADIWPVQKQHIITIIADAGLAQLKTRLSPEASATVTNIVVLVNQILSGAGGPTL